MRDQFKSRCIQPLKVVEEQDERVFRPGESAEETTKHQLETVLGISRRHVWDGRLFSENEFHLRYEVDNQLAVWT